MIGAAPQASSPTYKQEVKGKGDNDTTTFTVVSFHDGFSSDSYLAIRNVSYAVGTIPVTVSVDGTTYGSVSVNNNGTTVTDFSKPVEVEAGKSLVLTASPKSGGQFYGWYDESGNRLSTSATYTYTPTAESTIKAEFKAANYYKAYIGEDLLKGKYYNSVTGALSAAKSGDIVTLMTDCTLEDSATIPSGVVLVVPKSGESYRFNGGLDSYYSEFGKNGATSTLYRTFTVPSGKTLTVNGGLLIDAVTCGNSSSFVGVNGAYAKIALAGNIVCNSGSVVKCLGYIEGAGTVTVNNGARFHETYYADNWKGGTEAKNQLDNRRFPFYEGKSNSCRATLRINSGAALLGDIKIYANAVTVFEHRTLFNIINNSNGLYKLASGAYCIRTIDTANNNREIYKFCNSKFFLIAVNPLGNVNHHVRKNLNVSFFSLNHNRSNRCVLNLCSSLLVNRFLSYRI